MSIGGSIATGIVGIVNPAAGLALKAARGFFGFARQHWKAALAIAAGLAVVVGFLILKGEIRHRDKTIASQAALIGQVKTEVDRGVGKPTPTADAPAYIRGFVDNLRTITAALDRQSAALRVAQADADSHAAAAHEAGKPTPAQQQREAVRQKIADPARTTGLSPSEWSQL